jgi:predicted PurR-regulated permease PerM
MGSSFSMEDEHLLDPSQGHHPIRVRWGLRDGARWRGMTSQASQPQTEGTNGKDEIRVEELSGMFSVPRWLSDLGLAAWLLAGITLLLVAIVFLLSLTDAIVMPVVTAAIIAAVLSPVVGFLQRHRLPRGVAAALLLILVLAVAVGVGLLILSGITSEAGGLRDDLRGAGDKLRGYLEDAGVSAPSAADAQQTASAAVSHAFDVALRGLGAGIAGLASLAVFLSFTALSLFFLLKDGPQIRGWAERHMGVPHSVAHAIAGRTLQALRGYFAGVTAIALFNALVIGLGALALGVPRAGSIALVNFVCAYVPYLGAWSAGAFTVLLALSSQGPEIALAMAVITLLANGALQQMIQPVAFGATLGIHPLAVLIVTIGAGSLFGTIGLILAAPLTSAALRVSEDLALARARAPEH